MQIAADPPSFSSGAEVSALRIIKLYALSFSSDTGATPQLGFTTDARRLLWVADAEDLHAFGKNGLQPRSRFSRPGTLYAQYRIGVYVAGSLASGPLFPQTSALFCKNWCSDQPPVGVDFFPPIRGNAAETTGTARLGGVAGNGRNNGNGTSDGNEERRREETTSRPRSRARRVITSARLQRPRRINGAGDAASSRRLRTHFHHSAARVILRSEEAHSHRADSRRKGGGGVG